MQKKIFFYNQSCLRQSLLKYDQKNITRRKSKKQYHEFVRMM